MTQKELDKEFSKMILSASGFRKVFAKSGNPEGREEEIKPEDKLICTAIAKAFFEKKLSPGDKVLMGRDSRPTGKAICSVIYRALTLLGAQVSCSGITCVDELLAHSIAGQYKAFAYVSASHNPIGHNGMKFGTMGGVFGQKEIFPVIERIKEDMADIADLENLLNEAESVEYYEDTELKKACLESYRNFIINANSPEKVENVGIVADFNGSSRCLSIDREILSELGVKTAFINDKTSDIVHGIIPEGENLSSCCELLQKMHEKDPDFVLGYMPDNDGDRGNLVFINENGKAEIMKAQEVFALCVYSALEHASQNGAENLAVAVNCSTSMRIEDIAEGFNAKVFHAEIGEANVVNLADSLRQSGYNVPILGEGSNGGNITYPSRARDPMNTIMCMLRILRRMPIYEALRKLPIYTTTDSAGASAILHLDTEDYVSLKASYEKIFEVWWKKNLDTLKTWNIESFDEYQTEGIVERKESGKGNKGGLKMLFRNKDGNAVAFVWMRPSGTEPLFRILADVKGNNRACHDYLLNSQTEMILEAQKEVLKGECSKC